MKRKRSTSNLVRCCARHPFPRSSHPTPWTLLPVAVLLLAVVGLVPTFGASQLTATQAASGASADNNQRSKGGHADEFLLFGTVFTQQGFALPGARIRVRRAGGRKARWEARSDRRGEFAVRVPQGAEYELSVSAAGYQEQTRKIDARAGSGEEFVFRLSTAVGGRSK